MIARVLEPEVMDTAEEARDYDAMDHAEVNGRFCDDLVRYLGPARAAAEVLVLDVGSGTARIPILLCAGTRMSAARVLGIDLSREMLAIAIKNVQAAGLYARISMSFEDAKKTGRPDGAFGVVMCNTILHHIPGPGEALAEMWRLTATGGTLFVRDLARPETKAEVAMLVERHGGAPKTTEPDEVEAHARQRALFEASLFAGLTVGEVRALLRPIGIAADAVQMTSDRHWTLAVTKAA